MTLSALWKAQERRPTPVDSRVRGNDGWQGSHQGRGDCWLGRWWFTLTLALSHQGREECCLVGPAPSIVIELPRLEGWEAEVGAGFVCGHDAF